MYLDFLAVDSRRVPDETDDVIRGHILQQGLATETHISLYAALRQLGLSRPQKTKDIAADVLFRLYSDNGASLDVRAMAGYAWANYMRLRNRERAVEVLTEVIALAKDDALLERALYRRGTIYRAADQDAAFRKDMEAVLARFPSGEFADEALGRLAASDFYELNFDAALQHYADLRAREGATPDLQDSAYFYSALGLFARARNASSNDLEVADQLLREYLQGYPNTPYRTRYLFWRGRIAERQNLGDVADDLFRQVIRHSPYDYYGLRARMHLDLKESAMMESVPPLDSVVYDDLRDAYRQSGDHVPTKIERVSPYHGRLQTAVSTGLYRTLLEIERDLSGRIDDIPLADLDSEELVPFAALLVSLRQDVLAARDYSSDLSNWLQLMAFLTQPELHDWPTVTDLAFLHNDAERRRWNELQKEVPFLAIWYPGLERIPDLAEPLARAAWEIEGTRGLSQALMYAVIRHESGFYSRAISPEGALGLFQFMPRTFRDLVTDGLVSDVDGQSEEDYLLDPERNVALWAKWTNAEFPIRRGRDIALSVMKHQAGSGRVEGWRQYWETAEVLDDIEFQIETVRFSATRTFMRRVLRDIVIVHGAGIFEE